MNRPQPCHTIFLIFFFHFFEKQTHAVCQCYKGNFVSSIGRAMLGPIALFAVGQISLLLADLFECLLSLLLQMTTIHLTYSSLFYGVSFSWSSLSFSSFLHSYVLFCCPIFALFFILSFLYLLYVNTCYGKQSNNITEHIYNTLKINMHHG